MEEVVSFESLTREDLEVLTTEQLKDVDNILDGMLASIEVEFGTELVEAKLKPGLTAVKNSYAKSLNNLTSDLDKKKIDLSTFDRKSHDLISKNFEKSYAMHRGKALDLGDREWIKRATAAEVEHARKFGRDIQNGISKARRIERVDAYSRSLDGVAWNARIEDEPANTEIDWMLGKAEHCIDCITLAAQSPFNKENLPTTPKAGGTRCYSNCKCYLVFRRGALSKNKAIQIKEFSNRKSQTLSEFLKQPAPPPGLKSPSKGQASYIANLRNQINANRRIMAKEGISKAELKRAIAARRIANDELIEFVEMNNLYEVPIWSVDDVLSGKDIGKQSVDDIFRHGFDGKTLDAVGKRRLSSLLSNYDDNLDDVFSDSSLLDLAGE